MIFDGQERMQLPHLTHWPVNSASSIAPGGRNGAPSARALPFIFAHKPRPKPAAIARNALREKAFWVLTVSSVCNIFGLPKLIEMDFIPARRSCVPPRGQIRAHHKSPDVRAINSRIVKPARENTAEREFIAV